MSSLPPGPFDTQPASLARELDLRYYAELLWGRRVLLLATAVGGLALGLLGAQLQVPRFEARLLLQVMPPTPTSLSVTDALVQTGSPLRDRQYFNTQLSVLHSRALAERVADRLKLKGQPALEGRDPAAVLLAALRVEPLPDTYVVDVRVQHEDPREAALWANTLADLYMDYSLEGQVEATRRAYKWVNERLNETQAGMQDAQDKLLRSYQGQDLFVPEGSVSAITTSITKLNEDHIQAQARRIELEAQLGEFAATRRRGGGLEAIPQVGSDAAVAETSGRIQALTLDLARLREKYREGHPEVQKVQVQLQQLRRDKEARVAQIEESLRAEYRQLQRREAELKQAIDGHKTRAAEQSRKLTELESLKKQADSAAGLYGVLLQKLNETNIAASMQNNNVRLLDRAVVPGSPVWPRTRQVALVSLLAGLLLGATWVLLRDALDDTLKGAEDVERHLHLELLAAIPRYGRDDTSLATEAYQNLRTALLFARRGDSGHVVLVTGTTPGEGKTTTLLNLGKLLAVAGDTVVVVDGDLRRACLHTRLGQPREPGLTDVFVHGAELGAVVRPTALPRLALLAAGPLPPNPPALLARPELGDVLDQLRRQYRWVLVDSPPIAAVTDALLLARHADSTLLVVQHNKVDRVLAKRAVAALRKVAPSLLGAVLNAIDVEASGYYGYAYDSGRLASGHGGRSAPPPAAAGEASDSLVV